MTSLEVHPIKNGFAPKGTETLIVGTFPPKLVYENNEHFFFYSSFNNHFWNIIESIFPFIKLKKTTHKLKKISFEQNKIDKQFFSENEKIGFLDVFTEIKREKYCSSKDIDLVPQKNILDNGLLFKILDNCENINRICCTYKLAYDTLIYNLNKKNLDCHQNELTANKEAFILNYNSRKIDIMLLFPATRSSQKSFIKKNQYQKLIFRK